MSNKSLVQLLGEVHPFLDQVFQSLHSDQIDVSNYKLDHICYRVETMERYNFFKNQLNSLGELLTEKHISGRPIATFLLHNALVYKNRKIPCLELPAPKTDSPYSEGFEHVEFVIQESFEDFMKKHAHLSFSTKGMNKPVNPEIALKYDTHAVKFHHHTLEYVIRYLD